MARALSFGNVAACCASSRLARCRIFREMSCFPPLNTETSWYQCCVIGRDLLPSSVSLHSGVNEYLVGVVRQLIAPHGCSAVCSLGS